MQIFGVRTIDKIVSRSTLRDIMNRLRKIRQTCGVKDEEEDHEGPDAADPFRVKMTAFTNAATELKEQIKERNDEARKGHKSSTEIAVMSRDINAEMRSLTADVKSMEQLAEAAVRDVQRTNRKIAKAGGEMSEARAEKLKSRERIAREREKAVATCRDVLEQLSDLSQQRFLTDKEMKDLGQQSPADRHKTVKHGFQRQTLAQRMKADRRRHASAAGAAAADDDAPVGKRLDEDAETQQEAKDLAEKQKRQDAALDRIAAGLERITESAIQIGQELDAQDRALQDAEDKMDKANKDLKQINKGLVGLMKEQHPMNICINVSCFLLIFALLGFFLSEFGAI